MNRSNKVALLAAVLGALPCGACGVVYCGGSAYEGRTVRAFCNSVHVGERAEDVLARGQRDGLQRIEGGGGVEVIWPGPMFEHLQCTLHTEGGQVVSARFNESH